MAVRVLLCHRVYVHVYVYICACICICVRICICTCTCVCVHAYVYCSRRFSPRLHEAEQLSCFHKTIANRDSVYIWNNFSGVHAFCAVSNVRRNAFESKAMCYILNRFLCPDKLLLFSLLRYAVVRLVCQHETLSGMM